MNKKDYMNISQELRKRRIQNSNDIINVLREEFNMTNELIAFYCHMTVSRLEYIQYKKIKPSKHEETAIYNFFLTRLWVSHQY